MSSDTSSACNAHLEDMLPPEVSDIVFEILSMLDSASKQPKESLFACSLACKSWNERTFRHRFRSLALYVRIHDDDAIPVDYAVQDFVEDELFARSRDAVHSLVLRYGAPEQYADVQHNFVEFAALFPHLFSLELYGMLGAQSIGTSHIPPIPPLQHVTLRGPPPNVHNSKRHDPYALCDVLCAFSEIEELRLRNITHLARPAEDHALETVAFPRIKSLLMDDVHALSLTPVIQRLAGSEPMKKFDMMAQLVWHFTEALHVAKSLPATPEHILLSFTQTDYFYDSPDMHDFGSLPGLKRLTVAIELIALYPRDDPDDYRVVVDINAGLCAALAESFKSLDTACHLDHVELVLSPSAEVKGVPAYTDMLEALCDVSAGLRACEEVLVGVVQQGRLGSVCVSTTPARPSVHGLDRRSLWDGDASLRRLFPTLDELGVLQV